MSYHYHSHWNLLHAWSKAKEHLKRSSILLFVTFQFCLMKKLMDSPHKSSFLNSSAKKREARTNRFVFYMVKAVWRCCKSCLASRTWRINLFLQCMILTTKIAFSFILNVICMKMMIPSLGDWRHFLLSSNKQIWGVKLCYRYCIIIWGSKLKNFSNENMRFSPLWEEGSTLFIDLR